MRPTGVENTFSARVMGTQRGGTYSFSFLCRDQAGNVSNTVTVGPFTITGGGGGSIITPTETNDENTSSDIPEEVIVKGPPVSVPTEPETPKTEETPAVVPEKDRYVFLVDITPRRKNSEKDVRALQTFFNQYEGEKLSVNGVYDAETIAAVNRFQRKYTSEILAPWGIDYATGNVGIYTRKKIQEMMNA